MTNSQPVAAEGALTRSLKSRHIQLIALGGTVLVVEAAQRRLSSAADESERQLELFSRSVKRTTARLWRRKGPQSMVSPGRSSRTTAAS